MKRGCWRGVSEGKETKIQRLGLWKTSNLETAECICETIIGRGGSLLAAQCLPKSNLEDW